MSDYIHGEYEISDSQKKYYTLTTEEVRNVYSRPYMKPDRVEQFDRWLAEVIRKAKNDAWHECFSASQRHVTAVLDGDKRWDAKMPNPYRQGETE